MVKIIDGLTEITTISISGQAVIISGNAVFVYISGGTVLTSVSGSAVNVSGATIIAKISGETVATSVSGNVVFTYISGGSVTSIQGISGNTVNVSGNAAVAISSVITVAGVYLEWIALHMTSGAITSGEFYSTIQQTSSVAFKTKIISINPAANTTFDVFYQPDNKLVLLSGAVVTVIYSNPDTRAYGCQVVFSD
jgi:hypothetical protein